MKGLIMLNDINKIIEKTVHAVVSELKTNGLLKDRRQTPFQKTETLLYNYTNFKEAVEDKYKQIETIQEEGVPKKSASITSFSGEQVTYVKSEAEKAEEMIYAIEQSIKVTSKFINVIDAALDSLSNDPYFEIIPMKYFEGKTREDIAGFFDCDVKTVSKNKNRLINKLQIRLFSDEFIYQIFS